MAATNIDILPVAIWVGIAVLLSFAALLVIRWVRAWAQADSETEVFTLQDLRDMRARGDITETEFQTMRAEILSTYSPSRAGAAGGRSIDGGGTHAVRGSDDDDPPPASPSDTDEPADA